MLFKTACRPGSTRVSATASPQPTVFDRFERWRGQRPAGFDVDFLGVRTRRAFRGLDDDADAGEEVAPPPPEVNEEYFEWLDVLESVEQASPRFAMVELGAGWGRWLAIGAAAAAQRRLPVLLVGVEAEPTHFRWLVQHLHDNGVPASATRLVEAAVAAADGDVAFRVGDAAASYGQSILALPEAPASPLARLKARLFPLDLPPHRVVRAVSLASVLHDVDGDIDLIDLDIQGVEADVLESARAQLDEGVRRVHVGTHNADAERRLRTLFRGLGWSNRYDFAAGDSCATPFGPGTFQDGVQSWLNPRFALPPA